MSRLPKGIPKMWRKEVSMLLHVSECNSVHFDVFVLLSSYEPSFSLCVLRLDYRESLIRIFKDFCVKS